MGISMLNNKKIWSALLIVVLLFTGCQSGENSKENKNAESSTGEIATNISSSQVEVDTEFSVRDLEVGYDESTAVSITLDGKTAEVPGNGATYKDGVVSISDEGTYVLAGTLEDGQIVIDAEDTDKIQLVFCGVNITCSNNAPVYVKNADKVFITLEEGTENTLVDGAEYIQNDENSVDGVIFSKGDLTINGEGTLNITGNYKHGIVSKDDVIITGGTLNITAIKDAINGKDCVKIKDGTLSLTATSGNGIQSKNGGDITKGYVYVGGGEITITKCQEGLEGTVILIAGGNINIKAEGDGLNSASGTRGEVETTTTTEVEEKGKGGFGGDGDNPFQPDENCYISITGGSLTIDAAGDGIDSNGSLYVSGGTTYVSGPESSGNGGLDYTGTAEITGGTFVVAGSAGMAQGFGDTSSQYSILHNLSTACVAGTAITLTDTAGNIVASFTPNKQYQSVVISVEELSKDETYTLTCGDQEERLTLSSVVTSNGGSGMGGRPEMDPGQGGSRERPEGRPNIEDNGESI